MDRTAKASGSLIFRTVIVVLPIAVRPEDPEQVRPMIEQALAHPGPALVDVVVNRQELAMPPTIDVARAIGFSLYMVKAILNGRGDEVIDLARTNLFR